tara:strand:+ start:418 stop:588 length:171 start_codon:yes stop_codon:yes gene_type:complete
MKNMSHRFTVPIEENDYGEYVITLPQTIIDELGWDIGDDLDYAIEDNVLTFIKSDE